MVFITRRWANKHNYGPYYYLGWYDDGKIRWKYLGKLNNLQVDKLKMLEDIKAKHEDKVRMIDQIIRRFTEASDEK